MAPEIDIPSLSDEQLESYHNQLVDWLNMPGAKNHPRFFPRHRALQQIVSEIVRRENESGSKHKSTGDEFLDEIQKQLF